MGATAAATSTTRPYLRADARRRQLLDAAATVFARDGLAGVTMVAIAAEAGVSRRLVYDHFPDLGALYDAFFDDRFARYLDAVDDAVAEHEGDLVASFAAAFDRLLAMPADDLAAVRLVVVGRHAGPPELEAVRGRFRARLDDRWLPFLVGGHRHHPRTRERALLWGMVNGFLALADLVARGEITKRRATALALDILEVAT